MAYVPLYPATSPIVTWHFTCDAVLESFLQSPSGESLLVFCRKLEEPREIAQRIECQELVKQALRFESDYKLAIKDRDDWASRHVQVSQLPLRSFEELNTEKAPILVITPHPDDEIIGGGGTLLKCLSQGQAATVVMLTDGSNTTALDGYPETARKNLRLEEAQRIAEQIQAQLVLWREPDSTIAATSHLVKKMASLLNELKPQIVLVPFINDPHRDHIVANDILAQGLRQSNLDLSNTWILGYEIWSLVPPNVYSVIDDEFDRKARLLLDYRIPMKVKDYVSYCRQLNVYHAYKLQQRAGYTEAFFALDANAYVNLIN